MEKLKKTWLILMMVLVVGALAACGGTDDDSTAAGDDPGSTEAADEGAASSEGTDSGTDSESPEPTDPDFDKIIDLLKEEGLEVGDKMAGANDIEGATQVMAVIIAEEDMLPFQVYKMDPDSENLKSAKEKGEVTMVFEGQSGQIPMDAAGDYLYFLSDGHPDHDKVYDIMENKFEQE